MKRADKPKTKHGVLVSDCFRTPKSITSRLPLVDLDPCGGPGSTVRARRQYALEYGTDGKTLPWRGSVYVNFEYSRPREWVDKFNHEREIGNCAQGLFLVKLDPSTEWWTGLVETDAARADLWLFKDRQQFELIPEHFELLKKAAELAGHKSSAYKDGKLDQNNFASALIHWCRDDVERFDLSKIAELATRWKSAPIVVNDYNEDTYKPVTLRDRMLVD